MGWMCIGEGEGIYIAVRIFCHIFWCLRGQSLVCKGAEREMRDWKVVSNATSCIQFERGRRGIRISCSEDSRP